MEEIIIAAIGAGFPTLATIVTSFMHAKVAAKNAAKQSILQMIMEDHMAVQENKLPTNYQNILHEFDIYKSKGGNSYVGQKVEEYKAWWHEQEEARRAKK